MRNEQTDNELAQRYPFATKTGIELMFAMLLHEGAMCPKCGYGTRKTSKRWAKCKKCGERVSRVDNSIQQ